jgi:hypothetical protein
VSGALDGIEAEDETPLTPTLDLVLDPPITFQGGKFDVLHLREPVAREVRTAEQYFKPAGSAQSVRDYQMHLIQLVASVPFPVVEALPVRTLNQAGRYLQRFIQAGPESGGF